nr:hypothetical protein [Alkalicoccus halolimnae]
MKEKRAPHRPMERRTGSAEAGHAPPWKRKRTFTLNYFISKVAAYKNYF